MKQSLEAKLWVNDAAVEMNPFVEDFLARTISGAVCSLKGTEDTENLELYLEGGNVRIVVNGNELPLTPFPSEIIASTITGLVSSLRGIDKIESLKTSIKAL